MKALAKYVLSRVFALALALALGFTQVSALAQNQPAFTQQQLDQMLAPIALYPDPLLSQVLMASTYPIEVVEAARWSKANPGLKGDDAVRAVAQQDWDPSVKSLVAFPQVLSWMDENLDWTRNLGDAFLAQEPQVMETVQTLRQRAQAAGTLRSDDRYRVVSEAGAIAVVPVSPQIIYVPYYDPRVVYGPWWWPAYPPVRWRPWPDYYARPGYAMGWGPGIGISAGFFFGAVDWHRRHVRVVHVNNYYYNTVIVNRRNAGDARGAPVNRGPGAWQHDPSHRKGIAYRDPEQQRRFDAWKTERAEPRREGPQAPRADVRPGQGRREAVARPEPSRAAPPPAQVPPVVREPRRDARARPEPSRAAPPPAQIPPVAQEPRRDAGAQPRPPSASVPPPATQPAEPEARRKAGAGREAPQDGAPRPEARRGRESQANANAAAVPRNFPNHERGGPATGPRRHVDKDQDSKERRRD